MTGFVILHYMLVNITTACVESIQNNVLDEKHIVIVDNASPNGSGKQLQEIYADSSEVTVLINDSNLGFSQGNNTGYAWLREYKNCDFIVIMNNDTKVPQKDFSEVLSRAFDECEFDILGPDIVSMRDGVHQNPRRGFQADQKRVKKVLQRHERRLKHPAIIYLRKTILSPAYKLRKSVQSKRNKAYFDANHIVYGVPLHGACVIYSKHYISHHAYAFYPNNFMHSETEIMDLFARAEGLCVVFYPQLCIHHYEDMSTEATYKDNIKKEMFISKCMVDSSRVLLDLMERNAHEIVDVMRSDVES